MQKIARTLLKNWIGTISVIVVLAVMGSMVIIQVPPEGKYRASKVASEGQAYYEFKNGNVVLVLDSEGGAGNNTKRIGTYFKMDRKWVLVTLDGQTNQLRTTLLSIRVVPANVQSPEYCYRLFW